MVVRQGHVAFAMAIALGGSVAAQETSPSTSLSLIDAAKRFGSRPTAQQADISPDGRILIFLTSGPGSETQARTIDIDTGNQKILLRSSGRPEGLDRCDFVSDRYGICSYGGNLHYQRLVIGMSRSIRLDTTTGEIKSLTARDSGEVGLNQFDGKVVDWLPDEQGAVLMQRNYVDRGNTPGVDRVELDTLKFKRVESPKVGVWDYMTDGHGAVRLQMETVQTMRESKVRYRYRLEGRDGWRVLPTSEDFVPLVIEKRSNSLYYLDALNGRQALYRLRLDGASKPELVGSNDKVDIDGVIILAPGDPVIGYRYTDDRTRSVYIDPAYASLSAKLSKALPKAPLLSFVGASRDRKRLLIHAAGDRDPGAFYVFFRDTMELRSVLEARQQLAGVALASVKPVEISTRDGKRIPGYLTQAASPSAATRPTVIMPHGGPSARDEWGFDWLAQFLAARGYAVIQPNFRGSSGYGDEFLGENAFKGWKLAMSDIADSVDWAVKSGISDPRRIAIVGWSYGGYAALQSAALDPRYKAVVAIAPVTDLGALRRDAEGFTDEDAAKDMIGKGPHLKEGSPYYRAASIKAPVLLVHGDLDSNVRIAHSQRMEKALRNAGTKVEFLQYKSLEHDLDDSDARVTILTKVGELLDRTIGQSAK